MSGTGRPSLYAMVDAMCRSIITLRGAEGASAEEMRAAALQFVRKVSGYRQPSKANTEAFQRAVDEITESVERLLTGLAPTDRPRPLERGRRTVSAPTPT